MMEHTTPISPLLGLSAQIALLIPAVSEIEQQRSCDKAALERANTQRAERLKEAGQIRQKQFRAEILEIVRAHQGLKTNEVANRLERDRSFIFRLLREIEADGQVIQVGTGKVLKWEATK
jgi:translation initiation factor 2 beta subunit (eIF-2beta)/eIF-5